MKKYIIIFSIGWQRALAYRGIGVIYLVLSLMNIFLAIAIWTVAYQHPEFRSPEAFSTTISYFILVVFFNQLVNSFTGGEIADDHIKHGGLSVFLLKPFPYIFYQMLMEIPWRLFAFIMSTPVLMILFFLFNDQLKVSWLGFFLGISLIFFAYILSFLIQLAFALTTFWFEDTHAVFSVLEVSTLLFAGFGVPLFFFPPLLQVISSILPFQYVLYFPVSLALGKLTLPQAGLNLLVLVGWICTFFWINHRLWDQGLKKYTGEGI